MQTRLLWIAGLMLTMTAGPVHAAFITFEDLGVAVGTQLNPASGVGVISGGYEYTPGPSNDSGLNDLHIVNEQSIWSSNGTTIGGSHDDVVLTKVGGGVFSIQQFDFAGFRLNQEVAFTVVGTYANLTTITQGFTPDGIADGIGGAADFQTFFLSGAWSNLVSVTWYHSGAGTSQGLFALNNILVDEPAAVPEPAAMATWGIGAFGVMFALRKRQQKTLAV